MMMMSNDMHTIMAGQIAALYNFRQKIFPFYFEQSLALYNVGDKRVSGKSIRNTGQTHHMWVY